MFVRFARAVSARSSSATAPPANKDAYFSMINHISHIFRHDYYPERTLNKLNLTITSDIVFRVLRTLSSVQDAASYSNRFFTWARTHPTYTPTSLEFEELIKTLARNRRYSSLWRLVSDFKDRLSLSPDIICFLIEEYGKHGQINPAVELFNRCKTTFCCEQSVDIYNSLIFTLCENKMFHGAYALIRRMIRKGVSPNKKTYLLLVGAWCSNGKLREAEAFLHEMSTHGYTPPARGRDLLVEGLLNAGYLEAAKGMVRRMTKEGLAPDISTFNLLIQAVCDSGEVDFAADVYDSVRELGLCVDVKTYLIIIPSVSKAGRIDLAMKLFAEAREEGIKPFPSLYAPVIKGMCKKGMFDDAFCFFGEMKVNGHPPNRPVYTMLIKMCGRGGRFIDAANYLMEMASAGFQPMSGCFDLVVRGLQNCGNHDLARRIQQMEISIFRL